MSQNQIYAYAPMSAHFFPMLTSGAQNQQLGYVVFNSQFVLLRSKFIWGIRTLEFFGNCSEIHNNRVLLGYRVTDFEGGEKPKGDPWKSNFFCLGELT